MRCDAKHLRSPIIYLHKCIYSLINIMLQLGVLGQLQFIGLKTKIGLFTMFEADIVLQLLLIQRIFPYNKIQPLTDVDRKYNVI